MFYILFESTTPADAELEALGAKYYDQLQDLLRTQSGFIKETPYTSASRQGSTLLVASFKDESSAHAWRKEHTHLKIQKDARKNIFSEYRVRAGPLLPRSDTDSNDSARDNERTVMVIEESHDVSALTHLDVLKSGEHLSNVREIVSYRDDEMVIHLVSWKSEDTALEFAKSEHVSQCSSVFCVRVVRDYSGVDRVEAPR